ncbi:murein L,D-transpeptidase [Ahrensia sp. R2A130]|uniref:L,D-transpeptidase family protein n=1 Tax=Ahrensia sp. R2A130 TaxID=744979 RepID=UPI0001E0C321|nr:L,D-transpeptidase family protein [Ahrensia sp. R2A130]EFL90793.1 peptidoglycan binding domain-containing protein [Ahrensia sp. R2A130]
MQTRLTRTLLVAALSSSFVVIAPAVPIVAAPAQAANLFDSLFPRAAERRRAKRAVRRLEAQRYYEAERSRLRAERKRQRRAISKPARIKKPIFKQYAVRKQSTVALAGLAAAFTAHDQKLLAADALRGEADDRAELTTGAVVIPTMGPTGVVPVIAEPETAPNAAPERAPLPTVRLSAGAEYLEGMKLTARSGLGKALVSHYRTNPAFLWLDADGNPTPAALEAHAMLKDADAEGLNAVDYAVPLPTDGADGPLKAAMAFEFAMTAAAAQYLADARLGIADPNRVSHYHDFKGLKADYKKLVAKLAEEAAPATVLASAHPADASYTALKRELATLLIEAGDVKIITIKSGTFIRPGGTNDQVASIVEAISLKMSAEERAEAFDALMMDYSDGVYIEEAVELVRAFQKKSGLKPDGIVGKNTLARLKFDSPKTKIDKVRLAMERLRWHPDSLGSRHVFINQPAYRATLMNGGKPQISMRAVVGKPQHQTNFFHDEIEYVEFNPYWGIPRSILVNEMLPKLRRNPSHFDNLGYEVTTQGGRRISSSSVDWWSVGSNFPYNVRQPPGPKNALGELKIMFPNKHAIYMHDTPAKSLFKREKRAYSHGCVRLADPRAMAAAVLGTRVDDVSAEIFDRQNKTRRLKTKLPVFVSYFTAWPTADGKVEYFGDVYQRDTALLKAMSMEAKARENARVKSTLG